MPPDGLLALGGRRTGGAFTGGQTPAKLFTEWLCRTVHTRLLESLLLHEDLEPRRRRLAGCRGGRFGNLLDRRIKGLRERLLDLDLFDELWEAF